ncbi:hypothetical protein Elgi_66670 [Paenibacillus elgii]|nr:hypothetical protein Elgi_66670 [Paenibacillus elgii]
MVDNVRVIRLEQGQYTWATVFEVTTFEGPHNPPYHNYALTFINTLGGQPVVRDVKLRN